jgi:Protein of unknown function (DUF2400)
MAKPPRVKKADLPAWLEDLYLRYNRREFVSPDPLELVYETTDPAEAESVGFLASTLSYGRVASILASARDLLRRMDGRPRHFLLTSRDAEWADRLHGFVHRSLLAAFRAGAAEGDENVLPALTHLVRELGVTNSLVADPAKNGASKRLHMFLRWMIRRDGVDPGLWASLDPARLLMPLDVHSFGQCRRLGLTRRAQPNLAAVLDITRAFARLRPDDPVRYDFALTRGGIRGEVEPPARPV